MNNTNTCDQPNLLRIHNQSKKKFETKIWWLLLLRTWIGMIQKVYGF